MLMATVTKCLMSIGLNDVTYTREEIVVSGILVTDVLRSIVSIITIVNGIGTARLVRLANDK